MYKVVFITIYYNRAAEVDVTLRSMLAAKNEDVHIIAVDDGSTDDTYNNLLKYEPYGVEVITSENRGFTKTLSSLLENIDSEYIAICGSGDVCHKDRISTQIQFMDSHQDVVFCGTASRNIDAETYEVVDYQKYNDGYLSKKDFNESPPFTHGAAVIRASAYHQVGGYDTKFLFCQDWDLWLRLLDIGKGYFINQNLYDRRLLLDGASFNAKKTEKQLIYKYLALFFSKNKNIDRKIYMNSRDVDSIVIDLKLAQKIRKDMCARLIKLYLMKDVKGSQELMGIINEKYHGIYLPYLIIYTIIYIPVKYNLGLSYISKTLRSTLSFIRKFHK